VNNLCEVNEVILSNDLSRAGLSPVELSVRRGILVCRRLAGHGFCLEFHQAGGLYSW